MRTLFAPLVLLLLAGTPSARAESTTITFKPAPIGLLTVQATVAGRQGTFLFDSGSGFSSLSPAFAAAVGCHPWGQITGFRMTGQRLDMQQCDHIAFTLADRSFPANTVGVFDISKYLPKEVGHIDGTIALDLFADQAFTLSYGDRFLRLLDRTALAQQSHELHPVPVHLVRDAEGHALTVNLPVVTSAGTAWFEMDSGNTSSLVLVNKALAPLFGLAPDGKDPESATVRLPDGTTFTGKTKVLDLILDGNLGTSFLSTHDVTVDLLHQTAWISSSASPTATSDGH